MKKAIQLLIGLLLAPLSLAAEPYTFTPDNYIEYGIYFSARGISSTSHKKLLTLRYGDIEGYYANVLKTKSKAPTPKQELRLSTKRGSVRVNRNDNIGVTVTRDTHNERRRTGTKRLEIRFENGTCTDQAGTTSAVP